LTITRDDLCSYYQKFLNTRKKPNRNNHYILLKGVKINFRDYRRGTKKLTIQRKIWTQIISSYCQAFYLNIIIRINPPLVTVSRVLARIWHVKISSMLELFLSFKHLLSHDSVVICVFHFILVEFAIWFIIISNFISVYTKTYIWIQI
jgi:hypothetical protein